MQVIQNPTYPWAHEEGWALIGRQIVLFHTTFIGEPHLETYIVRNWQRASGNNAILSLGVIGSRVPNSAGYSVEINPERMYCMLFLPESDAELDFLMHQLDTMRREIKNYLTRQTRYHTRMMAWELARFYSQEEGYIAMSKAGGSWGLAKTNTLIKSFPGGPAPTLDLTPKPRPRPE